MLSAVRDDLSVLREEICQGNLKILPEKILFPFQEKEWKQLYRCASNKENRVDITSRYYRLDTQPCIEGLHEEVKDCPRSPLVE